MDSDKAQHPNNQTSDRLKHVFTRFRSEIVLAVLTLTLVIGQYYQGGYFTRIGITQIWKDGYTADTRNRVNRFIEYSQGWKEKPESSLDSLTSRKYMFKGEEIRQDPNFDKLFAPDLADLKRKGQTPTDDDYVEIAQKYRNAIIECLNTMEAVKAIIQTRPWWAPVIRINPDTLEDRYEGVITDLTSGLRPFIDRYRINNPRPTPPWIILTDDASHRAWLIFPFVLVLGLMGWLLLRRKGKPSEVPGVNL